MNRTPGDYGYTSSSHPERPLYPQPHGYMRGRKDSRVTLTSDDIGGQRVSGVFSGRLKSPDDYQRRRTWRAQ